MQASSLRTRPDLSSTGGDSDECWPVMKKADKATRNVRKASIHTRATASVRLGMCPRHRLFYFSAWIKVQPVDIRGGTKATHSSWVPFSELRADKAQSSANVRRGPRPRDHHSLDGSGEDVLFLGRGAIPHGTVAGPRGHYGVGYRTRLDGMSCARTLPAGGSSMWSIEKESFVFLLRSSRLW